MERGGDDGLEVFDAELGAAEGLGERLAEELGAVAGEFGLGCGVEVAGVEAGGLEQVAEHGGASLAGLVGGPDGVVDEAKGAGVRGEAAVGVVDAEVEAELGAGGEHAVGLVGALADEVVDHDADVGLGAV